MPYIGLRVLPVLFGSLIPVVVFAIMRTSGYPRVVALLSASLVLFGQYFFPVVDPSSNDAAPDNAHIVQTRLILLDAPLILFMATSFYCYIRFYKLRYRSAPSLCRSQSRTEHSHAPANSRNRGGLGYSSPEYSSA